MEDPVQLTEKLLEDPKIQKLVKEAYMPSNTSPDTIVPPGVTVKEGLTEGFIKKAKRALGGEVPEPTPEELKENAILLKKVFGTTLAAYVCKQEHVRDFNKWVKGDLVPERFERNALIRASDIAKILVDRISYKEARDWMTTPNPYLLNDIPFDVIQDDPELVRKAALWRVS
jgi:hypothetical protein